MKQPEEAYTEKESNFDDTTNENKIMRHRK
jgi:hypothetical protein